MGTTSSAGSVLVEILRANENRHPKRLKLKLKRMSESAFAFFRGACELFAHAWHDLSPPAPGPATLVCGDLHLENFGAYRDDDGEFLFDINDFDEAVVAPCVIDTARCATSILLAGELWGLTPLHANRLVLAYLDEYRAALQSAEHADYLEAVAPRLSKGPIWEILGRTAAGSQAALLDRHTERLKKGRRKIVRGKRRHPALKRDESGRVFEAMEAYGRAKGEPEFYTPLDVTGRIAGIGSLGVDRYLVLVAGGGSAETNRLLDVKAVNPSKWLGAPGAAAVPGGSSAAAAAVHAQRALQARPAAGLDVIPIGGTDFRVREMIPEENRSSLDRFRQKSAKLDQAIVVAGRLTGLAHLRGARAVDGAGGTALLTGWATGPALDAVMAAASRFAERTRQEFDQFQADLRARDALPESLRIRLRL